MKNYLSILLSVIAVLACVYIYVSQPKIGYVRSEDLIYNFEGTKIAKTKYQQKVQAWKANVDTLQQEMNKAQLQYTGVDKQKEEELMYKQAQLQQYIAAINEKAAEEDAKTMEEVLAQVNSFTKKYAEEQGYDLILGTTSSGSLLYAKDNNDITNELLKAINSMYHDK